MPDDVQSIEDLLPQTDNNGDDSGVQAKLRDKQQEIKIKELERVIKARAEDLGAPYINLFGFPVSPDALALIDKHEAENLGVVCFFYNGKKIQLGALAPEDDAVKALLKSLENKYYARGEIYQISEHSFEYGLDLYRTIPKIRRIVQGVEVSENDLNKFSDKFSSFKDLQAEIDRAKVTDIVTMIMAASIKTGASDIHIEGEEKSIKVRFRIDGVLHDAAILDKELWKKIITRMKVLTRVKINVTDKPQDGRMIIFTTNDRVDIRASFLPTNYGESVVMRLLRSSAVGLAFEDLGITGKAFKMLSREIERPNGMIITTGPTGSGKTTTLYAVLKKLNNPQTKIITIEDPIEYQIDGINQSQTSEKYTFAQGLKSIVRQDPDIIMVGEIRDLETAEIAIQASLTGHLVLSTIHTNDAAGTVPRFLSMGAKPFLLAPALNAMVGQRLVRRVCDVCKKENKLDEETKKRVKKIIESVPEEDRQGVDINNLKFFKGGGCEACQGIGYKGRVGIFEILTMNYEMEKVILGGRVSEYDMRKIGAQNGMITMVQDGILKAARGMTSIEEVFRVAEE